MHSGTDPSQGRDSSLGIGRAEANGCSLSGTSISPGFALMHSGSDPPRGRPLRDQIYFCEDSVLDDHYVIGSRRGADSRHFAGNVTASGEVLAESPAVAQIYVCEGSVLDDHYVIGSRPIEPNAACMEAPLQLAWKRPCSDAWKRPCSLHGCSSFVASHLADARPSSFASSTTGTSSGVATHCAPR